MASAPSVRLETSKVPQADNPDLLLRLLAISAGGEPAAETLGVHQRQVDYYAQAARLLGFLSGKGRLLSAGRALLALDPSDRLSRLAIAFVATECARAWAAWNRAPTVLEVPADTAEEFLAATTELSEET